MSAPGLRRVADALSWYGEATADQLAREMDVGRHERPALEAALDFWVRRGDARLEVRGAGGGKGCPGGCCGRGAGSRGASPAPSAGARVWVWTAGVAFRGPSGPSCRP